VKRRNVLIGGAVAAAGALVLKPSEGGGPHPPYYAALEKTLKAEAPGRPLLVIDRDRLRANASKVAAMIPKGRAFRIVAKSLPSLKLLEELMGSLATRKLMVFHQPHLNELAVKAPDTELLLGKPMPVSAAAAFYKALQPGGFDPSRQLQWLIDTDERLAQYQQLAASLGTKVRVSVELDVGLHRGGLRKTEELAPLLKRIAADPEHLQLSGMMGYDAHVGKVPSLLESRDASFEDACNRYRGFIDALGPARTPELVFNGGGSPTIALHGDPRSPLTELCAGSCFVKPTDFDLELLSGLEPAAFIAAPVLKVLEGTTLPGLPNGSRLFSWWNPNRDRTYFIYGGLYMGRYESPPDLIDNPLYGKSTNQAMVNGSAKSPLKVDDWIFLRPTQSEKVLLELGDLAIVEGGKLVDWWPVLAA
jgi:D-serine deaminase-like pyridoxal phosphate-dependent protein